MATNTNRIDSTFNPSKNESEDHAKAKAKLVRVCHAVGLGAIPEYQVKTEYKTYYCDVYAVFRTFGSEVRLDLEVEDHDHSKHDFDDAQNKVRELRRYFIKTIWFKSLDILKADHKDIIAKIFYEMQDGRETDPRFNI